MSWEVLKCIINIYIGAAIHHLDQPGVIPTEPMTKLASHVRLLSMPRPASITELWPSRFAILQT
jgi:hypothetical protein